MKTSNTLTLLPALLAIAALAWMSQARGQGGGEVHYDNLDDPGNATGYYLKLGPDTTGGGVAQRFTVGATGAVTSVTMGLARLEEPGGRLIVSIREVAASTFPGATVGTLGQIVINTLPEVIWTSLPPKLEVMTIEGLVDGLTPGAEYFLVVEDRGAIIDASRGWLVAGVGTPLGADPILADWGPGGWVRPWTDQFLHARIAFEPPTAAHRVNVEVVGSGTVTASPEMDTYPAGTEVTLTALPNDGHEFVTWRIGEEEATENPYTMIVDEEKNVTAVFRSIIVPEIREIRLDRGAEEATLTWRSQADVIYEIETSTDLQVWESLGLRTGTGDFTTATVHIVIDGPLRFYRLRRSP